MPIPAFAAAALSLLPLLPVVAADPPAPATVPLRFAWPARLRCEVEQKMTFDVKGGQAPQGTTMRLALEASRGADGWLVRQKVVASTPKGKMDPRELEVLLFPPFKVSKDGAFAGLDLTAEDKAILAKRQGAEDNKAELAKKLDPNLPSLMRDDLLANATKRATSQWSFLVGAWAGKELPPGDVPELHTSRDENFPMIGPMHVIDRLKVSPGAACSPAPKGGCVRLEITSTPDPAAAPPPGPGGPQGLSTRDLRFQLTTTLLTDPRTLVPRSVTKVSEVELPDPGAPERKHVQVVDATTYRCK
ncbi:MAG TPA: hypothetical protein VHL80_00575 [Polyangia bacterium]|nr:hypothetical protein [Polyangia bacterium]